MLPAERDDNATFFLFNGRTALMEPHHLVDDGESQAGSRLHDGAATIEQKEGSVVVTLRW